MSWLWGEKFNKDKLKQGLGMGKVRLQKRRIDRRTDENRAELDLAESLAQRKWEVARVKVQALATHINNGQGMDCLYTMVEVLEARCSQLAASKQGCPSELVEHVASFLWGRLRVSVSEFDEVRKQLALKFGEDWVKAHEENRHLAVNKRVLDGLSVQPSAEQCERLVERAAKAAKLDWDEIRARMFIGSRTPLPAPGVAPPSGPPLGPPQDFQHHQQPHPQQQYQHHHHYQHQHQQQHHHHQHYDPAAHREQPSGAAEPADHQQLPRGPPQQGYPQKEPAPQPPPQQQLQPQQPAVPPPAGKQSAPLPPGQPPAPAPSAAPGALPPPQPPAGSRTPQEQELERRSTIEQLMQERARAGREAKAQTGGAGAGAAHRPDGASSAAPPPAGPPSSSQGHAPSSGAAPASTGGSDDDAMDALQRRLMALKRGPVGPPACPTSMSSSDSGGGDELDRRLAALKGDADKGESSPDASPCSPGTADPRVSGLGAALALADMRRAFAAEPGAGKSAGSTAAPPGAPPAALGPPPTPPAEPLVTESAYSEQLTMGLPPVGSCVSAHSLRGAQERFNGQQGEVTAHVEKEGATWCVVRFGCSGEATLLPIFLDPVEGDA